MRASFLQISLKVSIFSILAAFTAIAPGQVTTVSGEGTAGTGDAGAQLGCAQPPCSAKALTQRHITNAVPRAATPEELEEFRLQDIFALVAGLEQTAKREEDAGHPEAAAHWRGSFARRSGLSPEEAQEVKEVGARYEEQFWAFQTKDRATRLAVRRANPGVRMSRFNSPEIAALEEERKSIFINAKSELIAALGSKSFTRLDSYVIHSHANEKSLDSRPAAAKAGSPGAWIGAPVCSGAGDVAVGYRCAATLADNQNMK